jgi:pimeloyl-ACP methyl ester carboxylesterase
MQARALKVPNQPGHDSHMQTTIHRQFVTVTGRWGRRQVHCRFGGSGPLLLMLHQSPQSSRELLPLMQAWSGYFTVLAPDSPGYGLSDSLGVEEATLGDFAEATLEFLDAIGAGCFCVYGFHTGGMIGIALAERYPDRVRALACNGVAVLAGAELREILAQYLPRFEPCWDGSHLTWLWARLREQTIFFPWHKRAAASRMNFPMPPPERLQAGVLEFLRAADHYHVAYRAAFQYPVAEVVRTLRVPALLTAAARDPLCPHLDRITAAAPSVEITPSATPEEAVQRCLEHVRAYAADRAALRIASKPDDLRLWPEVLGVNGTRLQLLRGARRGRPVLLLHEAGGSTRTMRTLADALADHCEVLALDLPGHGESDPWWTGEPLGVGGAADAVIAVLESLGMPPLDILGVEAGGIVALEVASRAPSRVSRVVLVDPPVCEPELAAAIRTEGLPSLAPDWHGGHLSRCWHMQRDARLYFPWFRRDPSGIREGEPDLDARGIQLEVTERLKAEGAWQSLLADALSPGIEVRITAAGIEPVLVSTARSPWRKRLVALAAEPGWPCALLSAEPSASCAALLALLSGPDTCRESR